MIKKPSNLKIKLPVLVLCALVLLLWVRFDLHCPVRSLTGILCPGCGMARAWQAFFRLDIAGAFAYHPMFWAVPVVALFVLYDCRLFASQKINTAVLLGILLGVGICYALRLAAFLGGGLTI